MLPSARLQYRPGAIFTDQKHSLAASYLANLGEQDSSNAARDAGPRMGGKQEFVIVSAVQSEIQVDCCGRADRRARYSLLVDMGPDAALFADVAEVSG